MTARHKNLIAPFNPQVYLFDELPEGAKNSIWQYMLEGEFNTDQDILNHVRTYIYSVASVPVDAFLQELVKDECFEGNTSNPEDWLEPDKIPHFEDKNSRWPSILSGFEDETLQDGWKRCYYYLAMGDKFIPLVGME